MQYFVTSLIFLFSFFTSSLSGENEIVQKQDETISNVFMNETSDQDFSFWGEFMHMMLILALLVGVLLFVSWFLKRMMFTRMQQANTDSFIKILERRGLTPKSAVYLLEVNGSGYLVGETAQGLHSLGKVPLEDDKSHVNESDFNQLLKSKSVSSGKE